MNKETCARSLRDIANTVERRCDCCPSASGGPSSQPVPRTEGGMGIFWQCEGPPAWCGVWSAVQPCICIHRPPARWTWPRVGRSGQQQRSLLAGDLLSGTLGTCLICRSQQRAEWRNGTIWTPALDWWRPNMPLASPGGVPELTHAIRGTRAEPRGGLSGAGWRGRRLLVRVASDACPSPWHSRVISTRHRCWPPTWWILGESSHGAYLVKKTLSGLQNYPIARSFLHLLSRDQGMPCALPYSKNHWCLFAHPTVRCGKAVSPLTQVPNPGKSPCGWGYLLPESRAAERESCRPPKSVATGTSLSRHEGPAKFP